MGATQSTAHPHVLETKLGKLKGIEQRTLSGKPVCHRYAKVPYALPPTGFRRWRRPQVLPENFTFSDQDGQPGDYTTFGPICPQPIYSHGSAVLDNPLAAPPVANVQNEDCLYLNIWVPAQPPPPQGWPVQFHIHGGWLQVGDACQQNDHDPFDLLAHSTPRIIVAPTYRLNLFGFLAGEQLASVGEDAAPSNYGFWDQRAALEWTAKHISLFGGNPNNITVGGLSAGANSTFFQLYYDTYLPDSQRLIKRVYLWSNAVAIQPNATTSPALTGQFSDLCSVLNIPESATAGEKLSALRQIPSNDLIAALGKLKIHTFRASTDNAFIPPTFLSSLHSGTFTTLLAKHDISILFGEVRDEALLYKLVNPPSSYDSLLTQLVNYYPEPVVDALLPLYPVPDANDPDQEKWADVFSKIVADCQVHASLRGLTHVLLNPPPGVTTPLPPRNVHRYHIAWRAASLDKWIAPSVGVCHAADTPIWWASGWRAGYTDDDKACAQKFLDPFGQFLNGEPTVRWGQHKTEDRVRLLDSQGNVREDVEDELWARGMQVWNAVWKAQEGTVAKERRKSFAKI